MSKPQVTITYEPFKEIVIMEKNHFSSPEELARFISIATGGKLSGVYWIDGVVFVYFPYSASTPIYAKELVEKRKIYWNYLGYASMPKFMSVIETKEKMIVPVIDATTDMVLQDVVNWIKQQL